MRDDPIGVLEPLCRYTQKIGLGLQSSGGLSASLSVGNSSVKELGGSSIGASGGYSAPGLSGGQSAGVAYGEGVLTITRGLEAGSIPYGGGASASLDISKTDVLYEKTIFEGLDLFGSLYESFKSYFTGKNQRDADISIDDNPAKDENSK